MTLHQRLLSLSLGLMLSATASAQLMVYMEIQVLPCNGVTYPLIITSLPGMQPPVNTTAQTGANCSFSFVTGQSTQTGGFVVQFSCDGGITFQTDTVYYNTGLFGFDSVFVQLQCGNVYDCLGILNGPNVAGTACDDNDPLTPFSYWDAGCICVPDTSAFFDCLGVPNGNAWPGSPCDDQDPNTVNDTWDANCVCVGTSPLPCSAGFWVIQAYQIDSANGGTPVPIPNELWLWNLSSGGSGNYSFVWDFGDGTSSTDAYPTHIYPNGGPYVLCLTIDDGAGCSDTYCDSISVDANGIYQGMTGQPQDRASMTLRVIDEIISNVNEQPTLSGMSLWPNPVADELNLSLSSDMNGRIPVSVIDMSGRCVMAMFRTMSGGNNRFTLPAGSLEPGVYLLHVGNERNALNQRFVKNP
jgi:hypothetical protein